MTSISEKIFLFSLHEKRNGSVQINKSPFLSYGLVTAGLIQIILDNVGFLNSARKLVINNSIDNHSYIPADLVKIIIFEKEYRKCSFWIQALGHKRKRIHEEFLSHMTEKELLILDGQLYRFNPIVVPSTKFQDKEAIRRKLFSESPIEIEDFAVIKLMQTIHLLDLLFTYDEIKSIHYRIDNLVQINTTTEEERLQHSSILSIIDSLTNVINNEKE